MATPVHPGIFIRKHVLPPAMPVKEAAKLLGVGRPALSSLLNGKASLSTDMAARLGKAFGADQQNLLKLQADFDQHQQQLKVQKIAVAAYVPPFLKITAKDVEHWADRNLEARSLLPVFVRKLVNSTGQDLSLVDFPGYDQAEKKGWDGRVDAGVGTPWIPVGMSGWEFGCNEDPKQKADKDYAARIKAILPKHRAEMHFVFVTPRIWNGKEKWRKDKEALGEWKSIRVYDAGDIEQWLEQSLHAQRWLSERIGIPFEGVFSLDERWHAWASVTNPELSEELFAPSVERFKDTVLGWVKSTSPAPLSICGDSKIEALAFLRCLFEKDESAFRSIKDRSLVFSSGQALRKLTTAAPVFVPVVFTEEAERELGGSYKNRHAIIVRPRNTVDPEPTIVLDVLRYEPFKKALEAMGINDHLRIDQLGRESGYSPTILRRRLSNIPAIRTPEWAQNSAAVRKLIPITLVGAWHTHSIGDCEIMHVLAGKTCDEIERDVTELLKFDDPPVWSAGKFRGVVSKIDAFFAVHAFVTPKDLNEFFLSAEIVLSEDDPALDLPEDQRAFANLYGKSREHSSALRDGICETLVLLAVHGNSLFRERLGIDVQVQVDMLIRKLLTPLTAKKLLSQTGNLPLYAEAAPHEFLRVIQDDLELGDPQVFSLMKPADNGVFSSCPRTGLLWALENLAWKAEQLPRVCLILAKLAEHKIDDNWVNKPEHSLAAIFRCWMPQTAADLADRIKALELLVQKFPLIGWEICVAQFSPAHKTGHYSHRPRWRGDASGVGQPLKTGEEIYQFARKALDLALKWPAHNEKTLGDLIANLQVLDHESGEKVWKLVESYALSGSDENCNAALRERIRRFAFVRRGAKRGIKAETRDRAHKVYEMLVPADPILKHQWLFEQHWVHESMDELEEPEFNLKKREQKIRELRVAALQEIWEAQEFEGLQAILSRSGTASIIGWHMAEAVIVSAESASFLERCLKVADPVLSEKFDEFLRGFLLHLGTAVRNEITNHLSSLLSPDLFCRLLRCSPFQGETWRLVNAQGEAIREQYWRDVMPGWLRKDSPDLNEAVDRLLEARRPLAAFFAVHFALEAVETSRLKRLLQQVATCDGEERRTYEVDGHHLSEALDLLQQRTGVTEEEMARLEFLYIGVLEHQPHHIPNLEKQIGKSPALFVQVLALRYRRKDSGQDPPGWRMEDAEKASAAATAAYQLLSSLQRIPGTDENSRIDEQKLLAWVQEAQSLCAQYGRAEIGDHHIGTILSASKVGTDGVWPCEAVRSVLEQCGTSELEKGFQSGVFNSRGFHVRDEGGGQERALAETYRAWARRLAFANPYVANVVEGIAMGYERESAWEDSDAAVRKRLGR